MTEKRLFSALLLFAGLFAACTIGPDYREPETSFAARFSEAEDANASAESRAVEWWKAFEDEELNRLVSETAERNKEIKVALARVNESRALARQAFSQLLPGGQFEASYRSNRISGVGFPAPGGGFDYELYSGSVDAFWQLDLFGNVRRSVEAANADYAGMVSELQDALRLVTAETALSYFQLRTAQAELDIARKNAANQEETYRLAKSRLELGKGTELDAVRAEAQLEATRSTIPPLEAVIKTSIHRLSVLAGEQPQILAPRLAAPAPIPVYRGPLGLGEPKELLRRRPDLRAAERRLAAATARIGVAVGELYPQITFEGSLAVEAESAPKLVEGSPAAYSFGPRISWSIINYTSIQAQIQAAGAREQQAFAAYEQVVLKALEETENALASFTAERSRRHNLTAAVAASRRALDLAQAQYELGATDFLTVLLAQRTVLLNEDELARNSLAINNAILSIYSALGGGWEGYRLAEKD